MAPSLVEVRNHSRKQIFVLFVGSSVGLRDRLRRLHATDTPGWDYVVDDLEFLELAAARPGASFAVFIAAFTKMRRTPGWRVLAAASLRVEKARQSALRSRARHHAPAAAR